MEMDGAVIQKKLDEWFAGQGDLQKYITSLTYVPQSGAVPERATHTLELVSVETGEKFVVAIVGKPPYGALADRLLGIL